MMAGSLDKSGMTPEEIYERLTGGPGPEALYEAGDRTRQEWSSEEGRAQQIVKLGEQIRRGWQGAAGDAAFGAARPLADAAMDGADKLGIAHDLLSRQGDSFQRAHTEVRPMPPRPPDNPVADVIPFETDLDREIKAYQADAQHNIRVFEGYDNASLYNETNMPKEYPNISHSGVSITVRSAVDAGGGDPGPEPGDGGRGRAPVGGPGGAGGPGSSGGPGGVPVSGPPPGGSSPSAAPSGAPTSPSEVGPSGFPQSPAASAQPSGGTAPPGGLLPGGPVHGPVGGGSSGGVGGRGPAGGGSGGRTGGPGPRGVGPGPGAGALAAEEAAAARRGVVPGGIGRGAAAGMPVAPMGGGRGQGDEDEEHQPKIMIESGGEEIFGTDVLTAPQVIGDDEYED